MPFYTLESGEEILLTTEDIPKIPQTIFDGNPYTKNDPYFKKWRKAAVMRYTKAKYRAIRVAKNQEHFLSIIGDAKSVLQDPTKWNDYLFERDKEKRPPGRPPMAPEDRKRPPMKRSDEMQLLLADHGILVNDDNHLCDEFSDWRFCPNGRLQRGSESTISVFYFLQHYADT